MAQLPDAWYEATFFMFAVAVVKRSQPHQGRRRTVRGGAVLNDANRSTTKSKDASFERIR
jgi:hypothetical protein